MNNVYKDAGTEIVHAKQFYFYYYRYVVTGILNNTNNYNVICASTFEIIKI